MNIEKVKQFVALFGGAIGSIILFLNFVGVNIPGITIESVDSYEEAIYATIPLLLALYGVWKNTYIVTNKAKKQEKELQKKGLK